MDGEFLPDEPVTLVREGRFHRVPVIMGINANEMALQSVGESVTSGFEAKHAFQPLIAFIHCLQNDIRSLLSAEMYADRLLINSLESNFEMTGPVSLGLFDDEEPLSTAAAIYDYYLGGVNLGKENVDNVTQVREFRCSTASFVRWCSRFQWFT